jgi:outer membrane protein assembly factor BamB
MKRIAIALTALTLLGGCGIFGGGDKKPKTPVMGERLPVLSAESGAEVDPGLADLPVTVPDPQPNSSWTQPGGNASKSMGHVALGQALGRAWTAKIAGSSNKARLGAAPVVADGRVYAIDTEAEIHAFSVSNGRELWSTRLTDANGNKAALFGGGVSYDNGKIYATNGVGDAAALDAATGNILWKKRPGGPLRGAPTVAEGSVYVVSQDNQLFALKADTGDTIWSEAATLETAGVFGVAAPAMAQGTVVAGFSSLRKWPRRLAGCAVAHQHLDGRRLPVRHRRLPGD